MGLDIGANDYIVKPFSPNEVMARVRAVLRRIERTGVQRILPNSSGRGFDCRSRQLYCQYIRHGRSSHQKEIELFWTLASSPGRVFTRDTLLDLLWGADYYGDTRTVGFSY